MRILLLSIFVIISFSVKAQEMTVVYKENRKANYHQLRSPEKFIRLTEQERTLIKDKARIHREELSTYEYISILRVDGNKSIHYPKEKIINDTVNSSVSYGQGRRVFRSHEISEKNHSITYMNLGRKSKVTTEFIYGKDYLISEDLEPLDWEMTKETRIIKGYTCKKALLFKATKNQFISNTYGSCTHKDRELVEVWYTEEVKMSTGPLGYWGLPGLVVMVVQNKDIIILDKIRYNLDGFKVKPPSEGIKITRAGLEEIPMLQFNEY